MSRSPFAEIDSAFSPLFTDDVVITTKDGNTQSLKVFVATDITDVPLSDDMMDTDTTSIQITFQFKDWMFVQKKLQRGDLVQHMGTGKKYAISDVKQDFIMGWIVKAREIEDKE